MSARIPAGYSGPAQLETRLRRLEAAGARRERIGTSREGREIVGLHWVRPATEGAPAGDPTDPARRSEALGRSDPDRDSEALGRSILAGRPDSLGRSVLLLSCLHPMEWVGLETNLALLESWILGRPPPTREPREVRSIPVVNPDGFARVAAALESGRPRWVRGNAARVDLNRNFPVGYRPRPRWFGFWPLYRPGAAAWSEPESAAIARWIEGHPVDVSLSLHSFGRWIFYPPSHHRRLGPAAERHARALERAADSWPRGYRARPLARWSPWFRAFGTEIDFLQVTTGGLAFLVEISTGGIGRWEPARLHHPFYAFNPPRPEEEISRLLPFLQELAAQSPAI